MLLIHGIVYMCHRECSDSCSKLKEVTFEEGTTLIADGLFNGCDGLEKIEIPEGVTQIKEFAFADCKNLQVVDMSAATRSWNISI